MGTQLSVDLREKVQSRFSQNEGQVQLIEAFALQV
jgi:hypothetical protein